MYLAKVAIQNFRNLRAFEVRLRAGLNVLLGENNVGKTNLLDAIRLALSNNLVGDSVRLTQDDLSRPYGNPRDMTLGIDLWFADLNSEEQAEFIDLLNYNPPDISASLHYRATWNAQMERWSPRRWGGDRPEAEGGVPEEVFQGIPVTILGALRDSLTSLQPGRQSRLARLLKALATDESKQGLEGIFADANAQLEANDFIGDVQTKIRETHRNAAGAFSQDALIRASEPDFEKIAQNLRLVLDTNVGRAAGQPILPADIEELRSNGLGYNNLLYIATVMTELHASPSATLPLLLVEEPEAHLHPQFQVRLAESLSESGKPQTIVTSHSPTLAANVSLRTITVMHRAQDGIRAASLIQHTLSPPEVEKLQRLIDVTRAAMFFAKGLIVVEGISETLLLPVLAKRNGRSLEDAGVSVIPLCGVEFGTLLKIIGQDILHTRTSFITDADPALDNGDHWRIAVPRPGDQAARVRNLAQACAPNPFVQLCISDVTLEYALAGAGPLNAHHMTQAWQDTFDGQPQNLNDAVLGACADREERRLSVWRAICLADGGRRKAQFAQALADRLKAKNGDSYVIPIGDFSVPANLLEAIDHAVGPSAIV